MYMSETRWICDDCICDERRCSQRGITQETKALACLNARSPASSNDLTDFLATTAYRPVEQRVHLRDQLRVVHHEGHQLGRVSPNIEELQTMLLDEIPEDQVRRQTDTMTMLLQSLSKDNKRLNIPTGSNNLDDDVELNGELEILWNRKRATRYIGLLARQTLQESRDFRLILFKVYVESSTIL